MLVNSCYALSDESEPESKTESKQVQLPKDDFRFVKVEEVVGLFKNNQMIYEEMDEMSRMVGEGPQGGICYILQQDGEWLYIESGDVRGFVKSADIIQKEEAKVAIAKLVSAEGRISIELDIDENGNIMEHYFDTSHETVLKLAISLVNPVENEAYTHTYTTTQEVVVPKDYLISNCDVDILEEKDQAARVLGKLSKGGLAFCILEEDGWYYVESGDVRGFARVADFCDKTEFAERSNPEEEYLLAKEAVAPSDNKSLYYTLTSSQAEDPIRLIRESMVLHVQQAAEAGLMNSANEYEFMQKIYKGYGYEIPLTREEQTVSGKVIPIEQVRSGDLVYWAQDDAVSEPAMYVGNGRVLRFLKAERKIVIEDVKQMGAIWAIDFLSPPIEEYLGEFKLTAYCKCTKCSGKWSDSPTASGTKPVEGITIAMGDIAFGTSLSLDGKVYVVEDRGTPYGHIDIFMEDHERCLDFGVNYARVSKIW